MATTTPERTINESEAAKVTASAVARNRSLRSFGEDSNSPARRRRLDLTRQTRAEKKLEAYHEWLEKQAYAKLRTNLSWLKILVKKLPARRASLNH